MPISAKIYAEALKFIVSINFLAKSNGIISSIAFLLLMAPKLLILTLKETARAGAIELSYTLIFSYKYFFNILNQF